ncbi:MAG TPA: NAD-dependent epimerase/dehydratase family protein [Cellulomonas sp.]|nr:NAD-dependent epimerase/dehydratase family protein [Cellulomonas sp.]
MSLHLVLGKGPVGSTVAAQLAALGHEVVVVSRSGEPTPAPNVPQPALATAPGVRADVTHPRGTVRHVAADATDAARLAELATGAASIVNAANPRYDRWPELWPALNAAALDAAARSGAVLVTAGNLYGYGEGSGVMTESTPQRSTERKGAVRAQMWRDALARHEAGDLRATEIRASDYIGPGTVGPAHAGARLFEPLLAGKTLRPVGDPDQPHAWTYLPDFAAALVAAATSESAWGRPWLAPTNGPLSYRELAGRLAAEAGLPEPTISPVPDLVLRAIGLVVPPMREVARVAYQQRAPFVVDSSLSERELGVAPTPWDRIVTDTTGWWVAHLAA